MRGESVVVTDPKGEIHNDMRKLLESRGYKVKVFNLINLDLSNAWDCVQEIYDPITGNIDDQRVITLLRTPAAAQTARATRSGRARKRTCSALRSLIVLISGRRA